MNVLGISRNRSAWVIFSCSSLFVLTLGSVRVILWGYFLGSVGKIIHIYDLRKVQRRHMVKEALSSKLSIHSIKLWTNIRIKVQRPGPKT